MIAAARSWGAFLIVLPLGVLVVCVWPAMHVFWTSSTTYSHGYLIVALALWLGFRELRRGGFPQPKPSYLGTLALASMLVGLLIGYAADVLFAQLLAVPALLVSVAWATAGWAYASRFVVPAGYTLFAIPIWDLINGPLQSATTVVAGFLTRLVAIPAFIDENTIMIPSGTFEVEGGCSGLHYFVVAGALGAIYSLLNISRWSRRAMFLGVAFALAAVANWIRVFVIIVAGHMTDMQHYLVTVDHYYFGWAVFVVMLIPLFLTARLFEDDEAYEQGHESAARSLVSDRSNVFEAGKWTLTGVLLTLSAWLSLEITFKPGADIAPPSVMLSPSLGEWSRTERWVGASRPMFVDVSADEGSWYAAERSRVGAFMAYYIQQSQGRELIYYANRPQGEVATIASQSTITIERAGSDSIIFTELEVVDEGTNRRLIWYVYEVAGWQTANDLAAKALQVLGALQRRWDARVVVLSAECGRGCDGSREILTGFVNDAADPLGIGG